MEWTWTQIKPNQTKTNKQVKQTSQTKTNQTKKNPTSSAEKTTPNPIQLKHQTYQTSTQHPKNPTPKPLFRVGKVLSKTPHLEELTFRTSKAGSPPGRFIRGVSL